MFRLRCITLLLLAAALAPCAPAAETDPRIVLIAYAGPLGEANARSGRNAALIAIDEANKSNPRINDQPVIFQLLEQDDKADARITEYVARLLVNSKVIGVVGHWTSASTMLAAPIYSTAGLPQVSPASWSRNFTQKSYRTAFQILGSDDIGLKYAADYLIKELKLTRVLVLDDGGYLGKSMADYFSAHVARAGGEVVLRESINDKTSDFNSPLQKARQANPDLIFFSGRVIQSDVLARNLQRFHLDAKLLITGSVVTETFLRNVGKIDNSVLAIVPSTPLEKRPGVQALQKRYATQYGMEMLPFAAYAYDSVQLLIAAAKKANSLERDKILDALRGIKYSGISGNIAFDANGALIKPSYTLYQIENGKWQPLKVFTGK